MNISQLLAVTIVSQEEEEEEKDCLGDTRDILYKRKGINFSSSNKEIRALRQIRVKERRKSCRLVQQSVARNITSEDEAGAEEEAGGASNEFKTIRKVISKPRIEKKENMSINLLTEVSKRTVFPPVTPNTRKALSKSRREKLVEYLEEKKKLDELKRKNAKPAFKVGVVRHGSAPLNAFSTTMNNSTMNSTKMSISKIFNMSKLSSSIRSLLPKVKNPSKTKAVDTEQDIIRPTIQVNPPVNDYPNNPSEPMESLPPPAARPTIQSFAPENYEFEMKIPVKSGNPDGRLAVAAQSTPKLVKRTSAFPLPKLSNITIVETDKNASISEINDDVFTDVPSVDEATDDSTENTTDIDMEILASVYKNNTAKKLAKKYNLDTDDSTTSQEEEDLAPVRLLCPTPITPARNKVLPGNSPEQDGLSRPSTADCSMSPIKLQLVTPLKNIHTSLINNNSLTNLTTLVHNKSFPSLNCNDLRAEPVFKTPVRPAPRSAVKVNKYKEVSSGERS